MTVKNYAEKLRDPKWQKVRLEVFGRDNFRCVICGNEKLELHVHHKFYDGRDPWDYELSALETLCKLCHAKQHAKPKATIEDQIEIEEIRKKIVQMRSLIPNTWYPNTGWIEERLDAMTLLLNEKLNNQDRG